MMDQNQKIEMKKIDNCCNFYEEEDTQKDKQNPSFVDHVEQADDDDDHINNYDDESSSDEEVGHGSRSKDGSTSSNSTVEEMSDHKKAMASGSVRPYVRSKNPRLRWTPDLHLRFVHAIERLGGQERATPKLVLQLMNIKGLSISHVKSHLQMYRSKKTDDPNEEQELLSEGKDLHMYHLSQLPMLQTYNQRPLSSFRYQDGLCSPHTNLNYNPFMAAGINHGVYDRILATNNIRNNAHPAFNLATWRNLRRNNIEESQIGSFKNLDKLSTANQIRRPTQTDTNVIVKDLDQEKRVLKRKEIDQESQHVDLNLSLRIKDIKEYDEFDEKNLSLSLYLPSSSSNSGSITRSKHAKTSLDLTL